MSVEPSQATEFPQRYQIFKLATNKAIMDATDCLNIDIKRSKILITLVDYNRTPHTTVSQWLGVIMISKQR